MPKVPYYRLSGFTPQLAQDCATLLTAEDLRRELKNEQTVNTGFFANLDGEVMDGIQP